MVVNTKNGGERRISCLRIAAWSAAALVLLLPLVAMQFTEEVNWTVADFVSPAPSCWALVFPLRSQ